MLKYMSASITSLRMSKCYCRSMQSKSMPYVFSTPGPGKQNPNGEDASRVDENIIVVCDGVGGWSGKGVDPSVFSNALCDSTYKYIHKNIHDKANISLNKHQLIFGSIQLALNESLKHTGSSTICVGVIPDNESENKKIYTTNIGDSGYMIIRNGDILYKSVEMQYLFNFPVQIGTNAEKIEYVDNKEHDLIKGDILIFGTDGIWDNLFETDVIELLKTEIKSQGYDLGNINFIDDIDIYNKLSKDLSYKLTSKSLEYSKDSTRDGPFAIKGKLACTDESYQNYNKQYYGRKVKPNHFYGGKEDDITVVVRIID
eukprot:Mrub_06553.p1 GENE.Mrub_06553~~Mrub_06553.p1  ORF type:complete len:314 (+),score=56.17 Mrub_06553:43-984(+)